MRRIKNITIILTSLIMSVMAFVVAVTVNSYNPIGHLLPNYNLLPQHDKTQIECLAKNILFEAGSEPHEGQIAVAMVTMNRLNAGGRFGKDVCGVVQQKINSTCQFSWWCDANLQYRAIHNKYDPELYKKVKQVAMLVYMNYENMKDNTHGSLFYHATYVSPNWTGLQKTVQIGQHIFYKQKL